MVTRTGRRELGFDRMDEDPYKYAPWLQGLKRPPIPSWILPQRVEDDSWMDKEIEEEEDERMKTFMIQVKRSMPTISNERKREYISEERKRMVEWKEYNNDLNTTEGFEVGVYPYLACKLFGLITRYYYPPDTTITDFELANLTRLANRAIDEYNMAQRTHYSNVIVIRATRSFSYGHTYYLTFQASLCSNPPPHLFEAKIYQANTFISTSIILEFVRPCQE